VITIDQFGAGVDFNFTLKALSKITGGEAEYWDAYFDADGMDDQVRYFFESAIRPEARQNAVMLRAFLKRVEARL
jgi:hypothetical protein